MRRPELGSDAADSPESTAADSMTVSTTATQRTHRTRAERPFPDAFEAVVIPTGYRL